MDRRKYIKALGGGSIISLSGCLGILNNDDEVDDDSDETISTDKFSKSRISEPQYEIDVPDGRDNWDPDYLGNNMPRTPTENFVKLVRTEIKDKKIEFTGRKYSNEFFTDVYSSESEKEDNVDIPEDVDYIGDDYILVQVESGHSLVGSEHVWKRVEEVEDGYALYGYYLDSYERVNNSRTKRSIVSIESDLEDPTIYVNLTINTSHQIVFSSEEDVVGIRQII